MKWCYLVVQALLKNYNTSWHKLLFTTLGTLSPWYYLFQSLNLAWKSSLKMSKSIKGEELFCLNSWALFHINYRIYLADGNTLEVTEAYTINGVFIKQKLGTLETNIFSEYQLQKRSNFMGLHMKVMTDADDAYIKLDKSYKNSSYDPTAEAYIVKTKTCVFIYKI